MSTRRALNFNSIQFLFSPVVFSSDTFAYVWRSHVSSVGISIPFLDHLIFYSFELKRKRFDLSVCIAALVTMTRCPLWRILTSIIHPSSSLWLFSQSVSRMNIEQHVFSDEFHSQHKLNVNDGARASGSRFKWLWQSFQVICFACKLLFTQRTVSFQ